MFSLSDLDILFQCHNLAVSMLCIKIQFILNFISLYFREMIVSVVASSVNTVKSFQALTHSLEICGLPGGYGK